MNIQSNKGGEVPSSRPLVLARDARSLDAEAASVWGLNPFALVEAAGRACADVFIREFPLFFDQIRGAAPAITVLAGSGNNAADALVMLRALLLRGFAGAASSAVLVARFPAEGEKTPLSEALRSIQKLDVPVEVWDKEKSGKLLARQDIIIDGIAGTGLQGPLRGSALEMAEAVNALRENELCENAMCGNMPHGNAQKTRRPFAVSIDLPSGNGDGWEYGMPVLRADVTLAIEPQKRCLYTPGARSFAGSVLPVGGIFPSPLVEKYRDAELLSWPGAAGRIPAVAADAYKYQRGLAEIHAGSPGAAGAAKLAARGAQAAGAGLVRLIVDPPLYPVLAPDASGIMVASGGGDEGRFQPDAVLLGPGWGRGPDRALILEKHLSLEERGLPLILDADAIHLAADTVFHGNAVLTPHAGEFAAYTGLSVEKIMANPAPVLRQFSADKKVCILFKSHVLYIAAPDGRLALADGMRPALAAGGSGDVLAGFCTAIAARQYAAGGAAAFDGYACACAAAALLMEAADDPALKGRFIDPGALADAAAVIAGETWLPRNLPPRKGA